MESVLKGVTKEFDVNTVAFGDLFLTDIRSYRERQMNNWNLEPLFPIWNLPTAALARKLVDSGLKGTSNYLS
jgi:diphthamide synthase (EF-2-diphthine--ammonia ligase)